MKYFRGFIALQLADKVKDRLAAIQKKVQHHVQEGVFLRPQNFHITLKFLGNVPVGHIPDLQQALATVAARFDPFVTVTAELGRFSSGRRSIIWLGLSQNETLLRLVQELEDALLPVGYSREFRPYQSHITLIREAKLYGKFEQWSPRLSGHSLEIRHTAISLMESVSDNRGVSYNEFFSIPL